MVFETYCGILGRARGESNDAREVIATAEEVELDSGQECEEGEGVEEGEGARYRCMPFSQTLLAV